MCLREREREREQMQMETVNGGGGGPHRQLSVEAIHLFKAGIRLVMSRWSALRIGIHESCPDDLHYILDQIAEDILSKFTRPKESLFIYDLEYVLKGVLDELSTDAIDGSIQEVSKKLMIMHEECLEGNYRCIERLREVNFQASPVHIRQICWTGLTGRLARIFVSYGSLIRFRGVQNWIGQGTGSTGLGGLVLITLHRTLSLPALR